VSCHRKQIFVDADVALLLEFGSSAIARRFGFYFIVPNKFWKNFLNSFAHSTPN
jgi:hypothetical protein